MAFPLTYHRITNSYFRTCSTRRSRSQLGLYVYTHCMISIHAEPSFERLRYTLGGDRPSQTARLTVSPDQIHGRRLETQQSKGGIPRVTPQRLTTLLQRASTTRTTLLVRYHVLQLQLTRWLKHLADNYITLTQGFGYIKRLHIFEPIIVI